MRVITFVLGPSSFNHQKTGQSSLSLSSFLFFPFSFYELLPLGFLFSFLFAFLFFPYFSFHFLLISFSYSFLLTFSSLLHFLFSLWSNIDRMGQMRKFPPHFLMPFNVVLNFLPFSFISYFFIASHIHVAHCEPHLQVNHMALPSVTLLGCHVASPNYTMCHPTPHASKNVKSRLPRNPTKFNVVARFRETISTEEPVSSSEI